MSAITITPLLVVGDGFQPDDPAQVEYLRRFWLPILGPSTVLLLAELHKRSAGRHPITLELVDLAADLGLARGDGRWSKIRQVLQRAADYGFLIERDSMPDHWLLKTLVPELPNRLLDRLRPELIIAERRFLAEHRPVDPPAA